MDFLKLKDQLNQSFARARGQVGSIFTGETGEQPDLQSLPKRAGDNKMMTVFDFLKMTP
jgi:hypothetical protein